MPTPPASRTRGSIDRTAAAAAVESFLRALGLDPDADPELAGTGARVADAFVDDLCAGYGEDVDALVRGAALEGHGRGSIVVVRGIDVTTTCPHHLMPAVGTAEVAFAPAAKLVGVGTVVRLVQSLARRLILQEELGEQIVDALARNLQPKWAACRLNLAHGCMVARGERAHRARIETLSLRGDVTLTDAIAILGGPATEVAP